MSESPAHVVLSPHPDDAVISLGACISAWRRTGETVQIVTIFDGPPAGALTAAAFEDRTRYSGDPVQTRRQEDQQAAGFLGADLVGLGLPELVYRWRPDGSERCQGLDDLYGPIEVSDAPLVDELARFIGTTAPASTLHVPLAIGGHVDHRIVQAAAQASGVDFESYEDQPYAIRENRFDSSVRWPPVDSDDIDTWLTAIAIYQSQLSNLFGDTDWQRDFRQWTERKLSSVRAVATEDRGRRRPLR